jgi:hypothetical protein
MDENQKQITIAVIHEPNAFKYQILVQPDESVSLLNQIFDYSPKLQFYSAGSVLLKDTPFSQISDTVYAHPNIISFIKTSEIKREKAKYNENQKAIIIWLMIYDQSDPIKKTVNLDDKIGTLLDICPVLPEAGFMKRGRIMDPNKTFREALVPNDCWLYYLPNIEKFYKAHEAYGLNSQDPLRWPSTFMNAKSIPFVFPEVGDGLRHRSTSGRIPANII